MVRKREILGRIQLIISSFIWGTSYLFTKTVQQYIPPFYLMAFRLSFAGILLMMIGARQLKRINPGVIWRGAVMGVCLFGGLGLQSIGINSISPGTSAFLSASYCVFLPFLYWIFTRRRPEWSQFAGVILCMTGIGLVSLREGFTVAAADLITVASGLLYAGQMLSAAIFVKKNDPFLLSLVQLMTAAVLSWIVAVSAGPFPAEIPEEAVWQTVYLAVFCTAIGYTLQNFGQMTVSPTAAGVIVSTEAVFAVLVSMLFGEEHLSLQIAIGFAVIFLSLIVSETGLKFLKRKKAGENKSEQTIDDKDK